MGLLGMMHVLLGRMAQRFCERSILYADAVVNESDMILIARLSLMLLLHTNAGVYASAVSLGCTPN